MNLNGVEYYYIRNLQGDIIGLFDKNGTQVVSYTYDTWGKHDGKAELKDENGDVIQQGDIKGTLASTVGVKNPYRYRGYRYDTETGLYYLNSRYYNTEMGRFINMDSIGGKVGGLLSHNTFAYCSNNPVNDEDPSGHSWTDVKSKFNNFLLKVSVQIIFHIKAINTIVSNKVQDGISKVLNKGINSSGSNYVYRALNSKDVQQLSKGLGLEAKNPNGSWSLQQHLVSGSSKSSWVSDPYISTTVDINIAKGFNEAGSKLGIAKIDLSKVSSPQFKGFNIFQRTNGVAGLPYHYSIWQQEISIFQSIPKDAIVEVMK